MQTNLTEAEALLREAIDAHTALVADDPKNARLPRDLAASHNNLGLLFSNSVARWRQRPVIDKL